MTVTVSHDPNLWRDRFPILAKSNYLVNHSLGAMPKTVYEKLRTYADQWAERGVLAWSEHGWWTTPRTVGNVVGRIMNAPEDSVVMHQNVSVIQSIVASALDFSGERNRVVYSDLNFPTNMYVWEGFVRWGAEIVTVPSADGITVSTEELVEAIDERTLIVPISHVCFRSSYLQDVEAVCARAREVGALVLLDAYQSLGAVPLDVQEIGVDMVCGGSVKWLCGGPGAGYLYVRPTLVDELTPRITGWAAHADPFAFERGAQKYTSGIERMLHGTPAVPALLAATAGYEIIQEVGVTAIRQWSMHLTEKLRLSLLEAGFQVPSPEDPNRRGGMLIVALDEDEQGTAFVAALAARSIQVDYRPGAGLRVSPHFYTREEELDEFVEILVELRRTKSWRDFVSTAGEY